MGRIRGRGRVKGKDKDRGSREARVRQPKLVLMLRLAQVKGLMLV